LSSLDEALCARILSRSSTPSALYDALGDALESAGVPAYTGLHTTPQFDDTLGKSVPLRILVAEDNEINRKVVLRMLSGFGYKADVAVNGSEVIEAVRRQTYDLVLMDIEMPKVDGIEATKLIVATTARERRPRIIAMSANVMREHVAAALAAGADKYIAKPFAPSELRTALEESADRALPVGGSAEHPSPRILSHERLRCHVEADGSGEFLKELARDFASASLQFQNRLITAVRAGHDSELRAVLHEYAGVCAVLGADKLAHLLLEVQKIVRAGSLKGAALLLEQCQQAREETLGAFEAAIAR
jgi:CheY-like chemotaxis protein/HPt (histidine-containing phosphotransfer) domain-containing protein